MIAWLAVLLRDFEVGYAATGKQDTERIADAKLLDPSTYWDRIIAGIYLVNGDARRAAAEAEKVVREEPRNIAAWAVLYRATLRSDPRRAEEAEAVIRRLDPLATSRGR
jgi:Tfp pilus assembly protein PilF